MLWMDWDCPVQTRLGLDLRPGDRQGSDVVNRDGQQGSRNFPRAHRLHMSANSPVPPSPVSFCFFIPLTSRYGTVMV